MNCPRLAAFHEANRAQYPDFHNAPVPSFGALTNRLLVVGLAPGLKGANRTGRPFTGDYAGVVLYPALLKHGFAEGNYNPDNLSSRAKSRDLEDPSTRLCLAQDDNTKDTLELLDCRITNAVRCVPPENKPETSEIRQCNGFLKAEIAAMPNLNLILSLGLIAHNAVLRALGYKQSYAKFAHGAVHDLGDMKLLNSYHCSRYNINTGTLTEAMFDAIMHQARQCMDMPASKEL